MSFEAGQAINELKVTPDRFLPIRYAGASGDFNPIHWNDRTAVAVGLPGVIAHGMFTMALAGRAVCHWAGDPGAIVEFSVRFAKPVLVPDDDDGTWVEISGSVRSVTDDRAEVDITAVCAGEKILSLARATVVTRAPR